MRIVIVGGGTGGWLCAARIKQKLPEADVTLIESPNVPPMGVGESVVPPLRLFLQELGFEDKDWMPQTGSIYKLGNMFQNWVYNNGEKHFFTFNYNLSEKYMFSDQVKLDIGPWLNCNHADTRLSDYWLDLYNSGIKKPEELNPDTDCQHYFMENLLSPYKDENYILNPLWSSSLHVNADKLGSVIRDNKALGMGVKHIKSHIKEVVLNENGVEKLITDQGDLSADYYLDCSGLGRLLIKKVSDSWKDYDFIPVKKCWVMPVKYDNPYEEMTNYTQSLAMKAGWRFKVTLYHRYGTGYCFDENFISEQQALDEIIQQVPEKNLIRSPRLLKWDPGHFSEPWTKNVIAIGLSAGFAEPMEANGLYLTISNIDETWRQLKKIHDREYGVEEASRRYNHKSVILFNDTYEFLYPHYHLTKRTDSEFWKYQQYLNIKNGTEDMVRSHYRSPVNTTQMCGDGYTIYPDYIWAAMAIYYRCNTKNYETKINKNLIEKSINHFKDFNSKWKSISAGQEKYYDWMKKNRFNGLDHNDVQNQLDI